MSRKSAASGVIALDRASVRSYDEDGHLHVLSSIISAAQVNPYYGHEIPNAEALGLDPQKKYMLLRDPAELEGGAESYQGKPLLTRHRAQTAEDHDRDVVVGSVINPTWEAPHVRAELVVWDADAIRDIESGAKKDLSSGYRYVAVMDPGHYLGQPFDGRMTQIIGNHVALVGAGRVDGAVVGDEQLKETRVMAKAALKNTRYVGTKHGFIGALKQRAGKIKLAGDADLDDVHKLLDSLDDDEEDLPLDDDKDGDGEDDLSMVTAPNAAIPLVKPAKDADPDDFLKKKLSAEDKKAYDALCKDRKAKDAWPEKDAEPKKDAAKDRKAKDAEPDPDDKDKVKGMDEQIRLATDRAVKDAVEQANIVQRDIREAERAVHPYIGHMTAIACDSAETVYRTALTAILPREHADDIKNLPLPALKILLKQQPFPGGSTSRQMASDSYQDAETEFRKMFPDAKAPQLV